MKFKNFLLESKNKFGKYNSESEVISAMKNGDRTIFRSVKMTPGIALEAVKQNPANLYKVKDQTEDLCLVAVKASGLALAWVNTQTEKICLEAVRQNGLALQHVKKKFKTPDVIAAAIKQTKRAEQYIKD